MLHYINNIKKYWFNIFILNQPTDPIIRSAQSDNYVLYMYVAI